MKVHTGSRYPARRVPPPRILRPELALGPALIVFSEAETEGLPEPVRRYFRTAIQPGTPLARSIALRMRGSIKLRGAWIPFRANQILTPHRGFVWSAWMGGLISGSDRYADGVGAMDWRLLGLVPLVQASGPNISRSAAARAMAEAVWLPTVLLPRFGIRWSAPGPNHIVAACSLDTTELELHMVLDEDGRVRAVTFDRWGDPAGEGRWDLHRAGMEVTTTSTLQGLTVPRSGRFGWFYGTPRWPEGEFYRFRLTGFHPFAAAPPQFDKRRPTRGGSPWMQCV